MFELLILDIKMIPVREWGIRNPYLKGFSIPLDMGFSSENNLNKHKVWVWLIPFPYLKPNQTPPKWYNTCRWSKRVSYKWRLRARVKGAKDLHCQTFEVNENSCVSYVFLHFSIFCECFTSLHENLQCFFELFEFSCKMLKPLSVEQAF